MVRVVKMVFERRLEVESTIEGMDVWMVFWHCHGCDVLGRHDGWMDGWVMMTALIDDFFYYV